VSLSQSVQVRNRRRASQEPGGVADLVPVNGHGGGIRLLPRASVLYLQARGDYVRLVADGGRFLIRGRMVSFETRWAEFGFVRVHRGYVVNLRRVVELQPHPDGTATMLLDDGEEVPVARRRRVELRRILGF
jgi:two-component system, LytTR family, response regulator LytT